jgi:hypothetical protein
MSGRRDAYEARFRSVIAEGIKAGTFAPADPAVAATFLLTALNGIVTWYRPDGRINPVLLAEIYTDMALRALLALDPEA